MFVGMEKKCVPFFFFFFFFFFLCLVGEGVGRRGLVICRYFEAWGGGVTFKTFFFFFFFDLSKFSVFLRVL